MDVDDTPPSTKRRAAPKVLDSKTFKDGAIYLYRRAEYKKPTWFIRLKIPGAKGYVWQSSKTTDEYEAYKAAEDLYNQSLVRVLGGGKLHSKRISDGLKAYVTQLEPDRERLSIHYKILLAERLIPVFHGKTFDELDTALISRMVSKLTESSKKVRLSPNTVKRIFADLRTFLNWAVEQGYADKIPTFPKVIGEQGRRPHFNSEDWAKLTAFMRNRRKDCHGSVLRDREMLRNYVLILANTGIRVGEARTLKWRDLHKIHIKGDERQVAEVEGQEAAKPVTNLALTVSGKTGKREVVARTSETKKHFERILTLRKADLTDERSDICGLKEVPLDSYVFCGIDGVPIGSFKKSFATLIQEAGVETDSFGQRRSLYSLRHTYATFRLHEGVNQYILAKNMGTSVAMLEAFYGHTSNILATDELTKSRERKTTHQKTKKVSALDWLSDA